MELTFIIAVATSMLFGIIFAKRNGGKFKEHKSTTKISLIIALAAAIISCLCDTAHATDRPDVFFMLFSTAIGFCTLAVLGYIAAAPREALTKHTDIFKLGTSRKLGITVNIITLVMFLCFLAGLYWMFGCADIAAVSIAALATSILLALLHIAGSIIAMIICIAQIIIRAIKRCL